MFNSISFCGTLRFAPWKLTSASAWSQASGFVSLHFRLLGPHFLAFWPYGPSFPCILALWAFASLHFSLLGLHFLSFWRFRGQRLGSSPQVSKNGPFAQRPYNGFISAITGSILQFLAFWAFISLHFGLVGLHFLAFWPRGPSFPFILAFSGSASGGLPTSCQRWHVGPTSLQWIYQRRDRLHFAVSSLLGLHFLAFWPCGPSLPCIWASRAFISSHFGVFGVSVWGPPHKFPKMARLPNVLTMDLSFPCVLAFWGFISFHFGLVGLHFLAFWPFRGQLLGSPPHKLPKMARLPNVLTMDLAAP